MPRGRSVRRVSGSDAQREPVPAALRADGVLDAQRRATPPRTSRRGRRRAVLLQRDPGGEPRARRRPRAGPPRVPARGAARPSCRRCGARSPSPGPTARPRRAAMVVHALRGAGLDPGWLIGADDRRRARERPLERGRVAGRGGRRVRPLDARAAGRARAADERRARPPHELRLAGTSCARLFREFLAHAAHGRDLGPARAARAARGPARRLRRGRGGARPRAARAFAGAGTRSGSRCPACTTRSTRPARSRWRALAGAGEQPARSRRWPRFPGAARRFQRARRAAPAGRSCTTTTPTTRPRSPPRCRPRARSRTGAWWPSSSRTCSRARVALAREFGPRAGARRRGRGARRLSGPRARRGLPRRERSAGRRGGRRRGGRQARVTGCRASTPPSACSRACSARAICAWLMGAGDVDALGRRLVEPVSARPRSCVRRDSSARAR